MDEAIAQGTERVISGQRRVYYDGYWIRAYDVPADRWHAKKQLIEAMTRRLFQHMEHGINIPGVRLEPLYVECDPALRGGYYWVFPHQDYTSIGAVAETHAVRPAELRAYVDERLARLGLACQRAPFEGATLEVEFRGLHFPGDVHLAGDAAGVPSSLTAEGIYSALLTGEEVAREIVEPRYRSARVARCSSLRCWRTH